MYTNGLKDRFGNLFISKRNIIVLDERGTTATLDDACGRIIEVTSDGEYITITHKNDLIFLTESNMIKDAESVFNDKVTVGQTTINVQPDRVFSSVGCTDFIKKVCSQFNTPFDNLRILSGAETLEDDFSNLTVKISLPKLERMEGTLFQSFGSVILDLPQLTYADGVFSGDTTTYINGSLPSLYYQDCLCQGMTSLQAFHCSCPRLFIGNNMFNGCTSLGSFVGDLSSLIVGVGMFENTNLSIESVEGLTKTLSDLTSLKESSTNDVSLKLNLITVVDAEPSVEEVTKTISYGDIGKITISWTSLDDLSFDERATIVYELFPILEKKGWTITTNLTEDVIFDEDDDVLDDNSEIE